MDKTATGSVAEIKKEKANKATKSISRAPSLLKVKSIKKMTIEDIKVPTIANIIIPPIYLKKGFLSIL